jgi:hypothetical protein
MSSQDVAAIAPNYGAGIDAPNYAAGVDAPNYAAGVDAPNYAAGVERGPDSQSPVSSGEAAGHTTEAAIETFLRDAFRPVVDAA